MYLQDIWGFKLFFIRSPTQFFFCILSSVCAETVQNSISSSSLSMSKLPEESEIYKSRLDVFECYHTWLSEVLKCLKANQLMIYG